MCANGGTKNVAAAHWNVRARGHGSIRVTPVDRMRERVAAEDADVAAHIRDGLKSVPPCIGRFELSLATMLWTHGRRCPLTHLTGRLRCPKCGSTWVMMMWVAPLEAVAGRVRR